MEGNLSVTDVCIANEAKATWDDGLLAGNNYVAGTKWWAGCAIQEREKSPGVRELYFQTFGDIGISKEIVSSKNIQYLHIINIPSIAPGQYVLELGLDALTNYNAGNTQGEAVIKGLDTMGFGHDEFGQPLSFWDVCGGTAHFQSPDGSYSHVPLPPSALLLGSGLLGLGLLGRRRKRG